MNRLLLSNAQLTRLKAHKYSSNGSSLSEVFMQPYWKWLVNLVPLWVAPNLLTFIGLVINIITTLPVVLTDLNTEGLSPKWAYVMCAVGFFIYQSLDAIDGKQARRTGSNNPLGELFDHGCDAVSTFLVAVSAVCAIGLHRYPTLMLFFVLLVLVLAFVYHWQTYVCGTLHFKRVDVTEAQFTHMAVLMVAGLIGEAGWEFELPVLGFTFREGVCGATIFLCVLNMLQAFTIILNGGVGKNGSTVADTSVLSPGLAILLQCPLVVVYSSNSNLLLTDSVLLFSALCLPIVKSIINMVVSSMTKSPFPLVDVIMLGPFLAYANLWLGAPVPEHFLLVLVTVFNILDISSMSTSLCRQIATFLHISVFSISPKKQ